MRTWDWVVEGREEEKPRSVASFLCGGMGGEWVGGWVSGVGGGGGTYRRLLSKEAMTARRSLSG